MYNSLLFFFHPVDIVVDFNPVISVDESAGAVQVCARIAEGFIERELDVAILITSQEVQNEATQCKQ